MKGSTFWKEVTAEGSGTQGRQPQGNAAAQAVPRHQQENTKAISTERTLSLYRTNVNQQRSVASAGVSAPSKVIRDCRVLAGAT